MAAARLALLLGLAKAVDLKVGHWNVYWKALDDPKGRNAIVKSLDAAGASGAFDFFSLVEASGDGSESSFPGWLQASSTFRDGAGLRHLSGRSGHEVIALLYRESRWRPVWWQAGDMGSGRPFLLGLFQSLADGTELWVLIAHLPHWPQTLFYRPGSTLADALRNGSATTGRNSTATLVLGDFNEFGECSLPPQVDCTSELYRPAAWGISPLWDYFGVEALAAAVPLNTTTCCTKWAEGTPDWRHHFDRIFYTSENLRLRAPLARLNYSYPGLTGICSTPACIGDKPPEGVAPSSQGSWHRGWQASFELSHREKLLHV